MCKNHEHDLVFTALNAIPIYTIAIKYVAWIYVVPSVEMGQFFFALRFFGQRQKILRSHRLIFQRWLGSMIILLIMLGFDPTQWPIPNMWWLCTVLSAGQFQKLQSAHFKGKCIVLIMKKLVKWQSWDIIMWSLGLGQNNIKRKKVVESKIGLCTIRNVFRIATDGF